MNLIKEEMTLVPNELQGKRKAQLPEHNSWSILNSKRQLSQTDDVDDEVQDESFTQTGINLLRSNSASRSQDLQKHPNRNKPNSKSTQ